MNQPVINIQDNVDLKIIYIRFNGSYVEFRKNSKKLYKTLIDYTTKHNLIIEGVTKILTIYHDNPFITNEKNLRTSMAMTVPSHIHNVDSDEIGILTIQGKYAIGRCEIKISEYDEAWKYMYHTWLFKSKEKPRDSSPYEMYITPPPRNYKETSVVDIYIPLE